MDDMSTDMTPRYDAVLASLSGIPTDPSTLSLPTEALDFLTMEEEEIGVWMKLYVLITAIEEINEASLTTEEIIEIMS